MIDNKALMQQALEALINSMPFGDTTLKCERIVKALRTAIAQPVEPHDLQKRLEALDFYEDIAEHYAKCAISPEALRDWVAERMDMPAIAKPVETDLVAASQAVLDRWNSPQWEWVKCGPTGDLMQVLRDALDSIYIPAAIAQPVTQADLEHVFETLYDHGNGKYKGAVSKAQRDKAIAICEALKSAQHPKELK